MTKRFTVATIIFSVAASVATSVTGASSRYDIIMQRQPFWNPPPPPVLRKVVAPPRPQPATKLFTDSIRMCGITETQNGLRVGFIVNGGRGRKQTQNSYYLYVGESEDGIQVVSADFLEEKAVLRKGAVEGPISMRDQPADGAAASSSVSSAAVASGLGISRQHPQSAGTRGGRPVTSYREMLKKRQEERARRLVEQREKAQESKLTGEELQKHLEEYNLKLIRAKGELGPPLPIPLTVEQDAKLVEEGVLPARE